jgi:hypothetical protein
MTLMAGYAVLARDCGATIIGGCCGTTPDHLRAMRGWKPGHAESGQRWMRLPPWCVLYYFTKWD